MKINGIFEVVPNSLYSIQFAGESSHEFSKIFQFWSDASYLQSFFETHYQDLLAFWEYMPIEEAIKITKAEAFRLDRTILTVALAGALGDTDNLSVIFKLLRPTSWRLESFEKSKARGFRKRSWLRVYAIRVRSEPFCCNGWCD